jgi:geranylgeranyl diphosphate synthase type I
MMSSSLQSTMLQAAEEEILTIVQEVGESGLEPLYHMLAYHLGWEGEGSGIEARGKRIRPLLTLLACASAGGEWRGCLPAAAAVELIHNFSLIHDDIQDNSPMRRGRPTIWKKWGIPQAINAGDTLFTLAFLALQRLDKTAGPEIAIQANRFLQTACLRLTQGQYLDLAYDRAWGARCRCTSKPPGSLPRLRA